MPNALPSALRDRQDLTLPEASAKRFWLEGTAWEYPSYENADVFVERLERAGVLRMDPLVEASLRGDGPTSAARTVERHWAQRAGIRQGLARQIDRARNAVRLLQEGVPPIDVAQIGEYFDQAHLTRELKRFTGETPGAIVRQERQLSYLEKME
jgi:hypothetical protein